MTTGNKVRTQLDKFLPLTQFVCGCPISRHNIVAPHRCGVSNKNRASAAQTLGLSGVLSPMCSHVFVQLCKILVEKACMVVQHG